MINDNAECEMFTSTFNTFLETEKFQRNGFFCVIRQELQINVSRGYGFPNNPLHPHQNQKEKKSMVWTESG